jgi:hypothetical protein
MLFAKELLCVLLGGWLVVSTHRRLARGGFARAWRVWFIVLLIVGGALAPRLMGIRYLESPTSRAYGVPFVIAGGDFIDGRWADGGVGLYMPLPALADLAVGVAVCVVPLAILSLFHSRKIQRGGAHVA